MIGSMLFLRPSTSRTGNFGYAFNTGWAFISLRRTRGALSASLVQTILGIIKWVVGEMPIESSGTTLCGMQFFQRHSQPPSRPARKFLPSSRAPRIVPLMFTYPAGKEAAQPLYTSQLYQQCKSQPSGLPLRIKAMPCS